MGIRPYDKGTAHRLFPAKRGVGAVVHIYVKEGIKPEDLNRFTKNVLDGAGFSGFVLTNK